MKKAHFTKYINSDQENLSHFILTKWYNNVALQTQISSQFIIRVAQCWVIYAIINKKRRYNLWLAKHIDGHAICFLIQP